MFGMKAHWRRERVQGCGDFSWLSCWWAGEHLSSSWGSKLLPFGKCKHTAFFLLRSVGGTSAGVQTLPLQGFLTPFEKRLLLFIFISLCRFKVLAYMISLEEPQTSVFL